MTAKKGSCGNKPRVGKVGDRKGQGASTLVERGNY